MYKTLDEGTLVKRMHVIPKLRDNIKMSMSDKKIDSSSFLFDPLKKKKNSKLTKLENVCT